jgi:hypothetical protein
MSKNKPKKKPSGNTQQKDLYMIVLFFDSEDGGNLFFRNVSKFLPDNTTSH